MTQTHKTGFYTYCMSGPNKGVAAYAGMSVKDAWRHILQMDEVDAISSVPVRFDGDLWLLGSTGGVLPPPKTIVEA